MSLICIKCKEKHFEYLLSVYEILESKHFCEILTRLPFSKFKIEIFKGKNGAHITHVWSQYFVLAEWWTHTFPL